MFSVYSVAGKGVVICSRWNFGIVELPPRAASFSAVTLTRCHSVEPIAYHLPVLDDHGPHLAAGARGHRRPEYSEIKKEVIPAGASHQDTPE